MAGLASFMSGFTEGTDTRHRWDDRKRQIALDAEDRKWLNENRDWARGDREYTLEERQRIRAEQDRVAAEQKAERDAAAAAWAETQAASAADEAAAAAGGVAPQSVDPALGDMGMGQGGLSFGLPPAEANPLAPGARSLPMPPQVSAPGPAGMPQSAMPQSPTMPPPQARSVQPAAPHVMPQIADLSRADGGGRLRNESIGPAGMPGYPVVPQQAPQTQAAPPQARSLPDAQQPGQPPVGTAAPVQPASPITVRASAGPGRGGNNMSQGQPPADLGAATGSPPPAPTIRAPTAPASVPPTNPAAVSAGRSALSFNNPLTVKPERADKAVKTTLQHYQEVGVPKMIDHYLKTGQFEKARAMEAWSKDAKSKESMELWARGLHAYAVGDEHGMLDNFAKYYNSLGMDVTVDRKKSAMTRDEQGNVTGVDVVFIDRSGKETTQHFDGTGDLLQEGIMGMQPDKMFELLYGQEVAASAARGKAQALEVSVQIAAMKLKGAGVSADPARIAKVAAAIAQSDMTGSFFTKTPEEQGQMIADALAGQDYAETLRSGAAAGAMGGGDALPMMY